MDDYEEFMSRSPEDVVLAIFDRLGVKLEGMPVEYPPKLVFISVTKAGGVNG